MNAIDGTDRQVTTSDAPPPSLLVIVLDTNPYPWAYLESTLPLSKAVANLLIFINAHLAINHANQVAVLASHCQQSRWLYPTPGQDTTVNDNASKSALNGSSDTNGVSEPLPDDANKYRPFRNIESTILSNLNALLSDTTPSDLSSTTTTMIAGALTTALSYINRATISQSPPDANAINIPDPTAPTVLADANDGTTGTTRATLTSRILILSVSGDLASQYIPVMNAIFAAQRLRIPIDILKLAGDTVFLQQACDATGGVYLAPSSPQGLLQYLMMAFLPDVTARKWLVTPSSGEVDFRAACFCHQKIVDIGFVCSVCLSIFCESLPEATCLTCGSRLNLSTARNPTPAVIARKKKKKKRFPGDATPAGTPTPSGTPGPS